MNRFSHTDLAERVTEAGHKMSKTTISEIELGARRVTVDDLMALAVALDVAPNTLLLPFNDEDKYSFVTGSKKGILNGDLWRWAIGLKSFYSRNHDALGKLLFVHNNQPGWMREQSEEYESAWRAWAGRHGDD